MRKRTLIFFTSLLLQIFDANAGLYVDGFGYTSKYKDGVVNNLIIGKEEVDRHNGGGFGASFGVSQKFQDVIYLGFEVTSFSVGSPTILEFLTFKIGFSIQDFSVYLLRGFAFFLVAEGGGVEYIIKKGGRENSSQSRAIAIFSEYKRYNHFFDDPIHFLKLGVRIYL